MIMFGKMEIFEKSYCGTCLGWQRYLRGRKGRSDCITRNMRNKHLGELCFLRVRDVMVLSVYMSVAEYLLLLCTLCTCGMKSCLY